MAELGNAEESPEPDNTSFLTEAFADAFEDMLREVTRTQRSGAAGAYALTRFFKMLDQGVNARIVDLSRAALARIDPEQDFDRGGERELLLTDVARCGLAYLIELKARDAMAGARLIRRQEKFVTSINRFTEDREQRRKALAAEWAAKAKAESTKPLPRKTAGKRARRP